MDADMSAMDEKQVFKYVHRSSVPVGVKIISCRWVYKVKPDKRKARLVIRGFMQTDDGLETFSPTLKMISLRLLAALAALLAWDIHQMDVCNAFLNAKLTDPPVYMHCVQGYEQPGHVIQLNRALYGLKNSPHEWFLTLKGHLRSIGRVLGIDLEYKCMCVLINKCLSTSFKRLLTLFCV